MLASVVLLDFEEIFLGMRSDLNNILGLDMLLNLLPIATMLLEGVEKRLMLMRSPILAVLCDDVWFARLLHGKWVTSEGACGRSRGDWARRSSDRGCGGNGRHVMMGDECPCMSVRRSRMEVRMGKCSKSGGSCQLGSCRGSWRSMHGCSR